MAKRLGIRWTIHYNRLIRMINPEATTGDEFNNRSVRANNKWRQVCTNMWMWTRYFITFSLFTYFHYTGTGSIQSSFMSWPIINCQELSLTLYMPPWEISAFVEGSSGVRLGLATWMLFRVRSLSFIVTLSQTADTVALVRFVRAARTFVPIIVQIATVVSRPHLPTDEYGAACLATTPNGSTRITPRLTGLLCHCAFYCSALHHREAHISVDGIIDSVKTAFGQRTTD